MSEIFGKISPFQYGEDRSNKLWELQQKATFRLLKNIVEEFGTSSSFTRDDIVEAFGELANDISIPGDRSAETMALHINRYLDDLIDRRLIESDGTKQYFVTEEGYQQGEEYECAQEDD